MTPGRGRFITIEGLEGAGKTTCAEHMHKRLETEGLTVRRTREPGGTRLGESVRDLLLRGSDLAMGADAEALLMFAARAQHIVEVIEPALAAGEWVLSDRFTDASYAYQGGGRGLGWDRIAALERWTQGILRPDATLYLDVPIALGLERAARRSVPDRFERERIAFFERVRAAYERLCREEPQRIRRIDATRPMDAVLADVDAVLTTLAEPS